VAVRIGFDDNRPLGDKETGGRAALPIFREIMLRTYLQELVGSVPSFPRDIEDRIDQYLGGHPPDLGDPQRQGLDRSLTARPDHQGNQSQ
jgi:membrane carboxypeptidase/penicillin-binding protein